MFRADYCMEQVLVVFANEPVPCNYTNIRKLGTGQ